MRPEARRAGSEKGMSSRGASASEVGTALDWINDELARLRQDGLLREQAVHHGRQAANVTIGTRQLTQFASNDYLGLAGDERLATAAKLAIDAEGFGGAASPQLAGRCASHERLERRLADFMRADEAIVFSSGYAANTGVISALVGRGDAVFSDQLNHASIVDGCRLSRADVCVYGHRDLSDLASQLADRRARRKLIVTDSLFSMDGDMAPLADIAELADRHSAMLMVDEAHAIGVFGAAGRGVAEMFGVEDRVNARIGTLSKALGASGGFVTGERRLIDWLANRARSYVFSTASEAAIAAAAWQAIEIVANEPWRRTTVLDNAGAIRQSLYDMGWDIGQSSSQIIPLLVGSVERAMRLSEAIKERGIWVPAIRPPSVATGESRLRISLSYAHDDTMIAALIAALADARRMI